VRLIRAGQIADLLVSFDKIFSGLVHDIDIDISRAESARESRSV
jgi:hypothetical protein